MKNESKLIGYAAKIELIRESARETQEKRTKALQDNELLTEMKRRQLLQRDRSKSSLITNIEDERRQMLTLKKEEKEQRLISARSKVELNEALKKHKIETMHK
jgi:CBS-domain-containing membrane protein